MSRAEFPLGFLWGAATSAYQIAGAGSEDGKGESIWDRFARTRERSAQGADGNRACDSYRRAQDDRALLREMNLGSYRFSISWPRIFPNGRPPLNTKGIDDYARLVDGLLTAEMRPLPALYHWDLPQALHEHGGWPERETRPDALYDVVMFLTREFERPALEITGSGRPCDDTRDCDGGAYDARYIEFHRCQLVALARAIEDGCDVRSYHVWSLLDHFEWSEGRRQRPGLASVNLETADRTLKESGRWYGRVAADNAVEV